MPFVMMVGLVGGLIMLQPDMDTFFLIVATTGAMFFVAGASISHVVTLAGAGAAGAAVLVLANGYRLDRWKAFVEPEADPAGRGYQVIQLLIALGSGGVRGIGLGESRQKFFYIPAAHTDGVFAIVGEELGFIGAVAVIALFALLAARGLRAAVRARDEFGYLLAVGVTVWIALQALINIGGVTRSLPLAGIPLPFLSYGMSSLITTLAAVGVLLSVSRYQRKEAGAAGRSMPASRPPAAPGRDGRRRAPAARAVAGLEAAPGAAGDGTLALRRGGRARP
jgi:cell division protein FtsW